MRLLSEQQLHGIKSLYIYADQNSYEPLARIDGEGEHQQIYYFHPDQSGLPEQMTDHTGKSVWRAKYKLWGTTKEELHDDRLRTKQNLRYQGQYLDRETGLHYNLFRYYDPDIGRFTQPDPIGLAGGINTYQYAPNPLGWVDPLGLAKCQFGAFKDHARRHGRAAGMSPAKYKQHAIDHLISADLHVKFRHNGATKLGHMSRILGTDKFTFTSSTLSRGRIFTHMPEGVDANYLKNIGITLPRGF